VLLPNPRPCLPLRMYCASAPCSRQAVRLSSAVKRARLRGRLCPGTPGDRRLLRPLRLVLLVLLLLLLRRRLRAATAAVPVPPAVPPAAAASAA